MKAINKYIIIEKILEYHRQYKLKPTPESMKIYLEKIDDKNPIKDVVSGAILRQISIFHRANTDRVSNTG